MSVASDVRSILEGFGSVDVVLGSFKGRGLVDRERYIDTDRAGDPVRVVKHVLKLMLEDFTSAAGLVTVARGDSVTIDGVAYSISDVDPGGDSLDGLELHLSLRKV